MIGRLALWADHLPTCSGEVLAMASVEDREGCLCCRIFGVHMVSKLSERGW